MPLPLMCSSCSTAEDHIDTGVDQALTSASTSSSSSSSSSLPSTSILSLQTFPSLPTLSLQNALPLSSSSAYFSLVSSLNIQKEKSNYQNALAISESLLFFASPSSISTHSLASLLPECALPKMPSAGSVKSIAVKSRSLFFTAHQDGKIRCWSNQSGKIRHITSLPTLTDRIFRYPIPSNHVSIRRHRRRLWIEHADAVSAVAFNGDLLYSVSWDKTLKIWSVSNLRCLESIKAHDDAVNAVAVSGDGTVYTGSADKRVRVWASPCGDRRRRHSLVATLERHRSAVNALAVSGDGTVLYSGACDRSILVWEREDSANYMTVSGTLRGHEKAVMCLSTVGDGLLVSGSTDRTVRIWRRDIVGGGYSCLCVMGGHAEGVRSVAAARVAEDEVEGEECYRVCSGSLDGEVRVWRVRVSKCKL